MVPKGRNNIYKQIQTWLRYKKKHLEVYQVKEVIDAYLDYMYEELFENGYIIFPGKKQSMLYIDKTVYKPGKMKKVVSEIIVGKEFFFNFEPINEGQFDIAKRAVERLTKEVNTEKVYKYGNNEKISHHRGIIKARN